MGESFNNEWTSGQVWQIARRLVPLNPTDSIAHAIEIMRANGLSTYPVVNNGMVAAMVTLEALGRYVSKDWDIGVEQVRLSPLLLTLSSGAELNGHGTPNILADSASYADATLLFEASPATTVIPVIDASGRYLGVVTRSDLVSARISTLAPARMGGMATPIGVYLTDGVNSGGAGLLGLMLTGMCLAVVGIVASIISFGVGHVLERHPSLDPLAILDLWSASQPYPNGGLLVSELQHYATLPIFLLVLRMLPLAGYHAAEHQVVNCTERGQPLTVDMVRSMPRVHPRCGTNIVAALSILGVTLCVLTIHLGGIIAAVFPSALLTVIFWQPVGSFLQQYFTTRPASDKQILSGISAAEMLMRNYRSNVARDSNMWLRIWRMGIVQVFAGAMIVVILSNVLIDIDPKLGYWLTM